MWVRSTIFPLRCGEVQVQVPQMCTAVKPLHLLSPADSMLEELISNKTKESNNKNPELLFWWVLAVMRSRSVRVDTKHRSDQTKWSAQLHWRPRELNHFCSCACAVGSSAHLSDVMSRARQVDHPGSATTPSVNVVVSLCPEDPAALQDCVLVKYRNTVKLYLHQNISQVLIL